MSERDMTPALGTRGGPGSYRRAAQDAAVSLARRAWGDARWSFLYGSDTLYAREDPLEGEVPDAARAIRSGALPERVHGPLVKPPVWTWEVPLYFWFGGIASGSAFCAIGCDVAGDRRAAASVRKVALLALAPCPPLLVADLGRPGRFLNMLRIFKPRSPMSMGAWCLSGFGALSTGAVAADVLGRPRLARGLGAGAALSGTYLGSYTGVLLATTSVPLWARSRLFLGPLFVATATATGAAAARLSLAAGGVPAADTTRSALGAVESGAMLAELALSAANERRLGPLARPLREGRPGRLMRTAKLAAGAGLALRALRPRAGARADLAAGVLTLTAGLAFRYAWVAAGRASAADDVAVAQTARADQASRSAETTRSAPA